MSIIQAIPQKKESFTMLKRIVFTLFIVFLFLRLDVSAQKGHSSSARSSKTSSSKSSSKTKKSSSSSSDKPVHVREYKRKDGTDVQAHNRSLPGTKTKPEAKVKKTKSASSSSSAIPEKSTVAARDSNGRIKRSEEARKDFMKQTGYPNGRKGYVVDHVVPLECGGADAPSNMQWQTVAEAKIKDRTERNCRKE
jgi:hypothetical protein